jgi:GNAT superfamily N-acetyltransferase
MDGFVELRLGQAADAEVVRDLTRAAYAKWVPVIGREPKPMSADYEAALRKHRFDLLYVDGTLAGLIETVDERAQLLVENVAVSPAFQGRGLGSKLMAHAEQIAASLGYGRIWLYTNQRFTENVKLYLKLGYGVDSEEDLGGGTIKVNMSKTLRPA